MGIDSAVMNTPVPRAKGAADRRRHPRNDISLIGEITDVQFGKTILAPIGAVSQSGFNVLTENPFPVGTVANVRLKKGEVSVRAEARVAFSQSGTGMGMAFTVIAPPQLHILESWLPAPHDTSWLGSNRRRTQRMHMSIPIHVSGIDTNGSQFEEDSQTAILSAGGALIILKNKVTKGQRIVLRNRQTRDVAECTVVFLGRTQGAGAKVALSFDMPNPSFWRITFPPEDWTPNHPDAKRPGR